MNREINEPVIVFGTGRSGTTVFHRILAGHERLAWLSTRCDSYPDRPMRNRLVMRGLDFPVLGKLIERRARPTEAHAMWERHCPGFRNPFRDLVADDVTPGAAARIRRAFAEMTTPKRDRLLIKITGWPRLRYLRQLFPDARFVHVHRDSRAVAASLLEVPWWDGWRGPSAWRRGPLPPDLAALWEEHGRSFVALAAIECVIFERTLHECQQHVPQEQILGVSYSRLCAEPIETYRGVIEHCGLEWSERFERHVRSFSLRDRDHKWRDSLSIRQQEVLTQTLDKARNGAQAGVSPRSQIERERQPATA